MIVDMSLKGRTTTSQQCKDWGKSVYISKVFVATLVL